MAGRVLGVSAAATVLMAPLAGAEPDRIPNGPYVTPNQTVRIDSFMTYDELTSRLHRLDQRSDLLEVESIGVSGEGRDLWLAKVGDPSKTPVMIINQQHGDEPHGAEASLDIIRGLVSGVGSSILDELYVLVVPRVNVDGAEVQPETGVPERGNTDYDAPRLRSARGFFTTELGDLELWSYDVNRYHYATPEQSSFLNWKDSLSYDFDPVAWPENPVPEALAVLDTYFEYGPIWVVDVHNQGHHVVNPDPDDDPEFFRDGWRTTGGILWSLNENTHPAAIELSKQLAVTMKLASLQYGHMEITRYDSTSGFEGIARNAYSLYGTERIVNGEEGPLGGSLLVEIEGQTEGNLNSLLGQKRSGLLQQNVINLLWSVLGATADGSLFEVDAGLADTILVDDANDQNPHLDE
jgi:hypothetical protein